MSGGEVMLQFNGPAYDRFCRRWRQVNGPEADTEARRQATKFLRRLLLVLADVMPGAGLIEILTRYLEEHQMEKTDEIVVAETTVMKKQILDSAAASLTASRLDPVAILKLVKQILLALGLGDEIEELWTKIHAVADQYWWAHWIYDWAYRQWQAL